MKKHIIARAKNKVLAKPLMRKYGLFDCSFDSNSAVIMFHRIVKDSKELQGDKFYSDVKSFTEYLIHLKEDFGFIKPTDLLKSSKGILLTFDDATIDLYETVFPILKKLNIPFVVFVVFNYLNKEGYISSDQLIEMSKNELCFVGAHSLNHSKLRFDKNADSEIKESIARTGNLIGKEIKYFAYPYGSIYACSKKNIKSVSQTGVDFALSTVPGYINCYAKKNVYFMPRFNGDKLVKEFIEKGDSHQ